MDQLQDYEYWRSTLWINTCLVDTFDTYDQYKHGLVDITHLDMRMNLLKTGLDPDGLTNLGVLEGQPNSGIH